MCLQLSYNRLEQGSFKYVWSLTYPSKFWIIHVFENFISSIERFFTYFNIKFDNLYIYKTEAFETSTIFHVSPTLKKKNHKPKKKNTFLKRKKILKHKFLNKKKKNLNAKSQRNPKPLTRSTFPSSAVSLQKSNPSPSPKIKIQNLG